MWPRFLALRPPSPPAPPAAMASAALSLCALPDEVLLQVFEALRPACDFQQHASWRSAAALGATSARFRALYRRSVSRVALRPEDSSFSASDVRALVAAAAPHLVSLEVARPWARISEPVALLQAAPPPRLRALTLAQLTSRSNLHPQELVALLRVLGPSLETLAVSYLYPVGHLHGVLTALADHFHALRRLSLENLWMPPHVQGRDGLFEAAWRRVGRTLHALSLQKAQENIFDATFLRTLKAHCPHLAEFAADGGSFASPYILSEHLGSILGSQLRALTVRSTALCDMDAATMLSRCPHLDALSLVGTSCTAATFRRVVDMRGAALTRLEMSHLPDLADADLVALESAAPRLVDLRLRRCAHISDEAFTSELCARLRALDIRDCPGIGDPTLHTLASVRARLEEIYLNESTVSEDGIAQLFSKCGGSIRVVEMRFKSISTAPARERIRTLLSLYCRSGVLERAVLE